ncbi:hypothetical protein SLEP1_g35306 [Rubroshorea leprosula]|uniref:Transposase (putative) gypsy type domain-containing protein n=1 Tax=Rubroshorea leprosula TaxID=152421 RepID=A0AAV5KN36_9ROSI|nr:hypothetical protein SLEP1_g35306 [Rubroshorea leprosula]
MVSLRELTEQRGNQGREGEEEGVLSVEPITMIVPPELQDVLETTTSESSASSSASDNGDNHPSASSSSSSTEETPSREEGMGDVVSSVSDRPVIGEWEGATIPGRLSNLRKAPKDLPTGFRFRAALHHEVADCAPSISGYKRLEEMVRAYHIPKTLLLRTGGQNERACTMSQTGWIPVYVDHFDASLRFPLPGLVFDLLADYELALTQLTPNSIRFIIGFMLLCERLEVPAKAIVFRSLFQCRLCPNSRGAKWYYLSGRDKSQLFKNVRNKLLPRDVDLKNQLLEYAQRESLIDLEALVTSEQLVVFGFVDVANLFVEGIPLLDSTNSSRAESYAFVCAGEMSSILERQRQRAQSSRGRGPGSTSQRQTRFDERPLAAPQSRSSSQRGSSSTSRPRAENRVEVAAPSARRCAREETEGDEDEVPLARRRTSGGTQPTQVVRPAASNAPVTTARAAAEPAFTSASVSGPRIAYPEGFSYIRAECQPAMVQGMHSFVPPMDSKRAKAFVQQHSGQVAMIKLMDAFSYAVALYESEQGARIQNSELSANCKQLAAEKAGLVDDVNRLQGSKMANRTATAESRAEELANKINELKEELERARAEKESGIQAAKDEAARVEERAKRAEDERDRAQTELGSLRFQVAEADKNLSATEEALNELKASHARSVGIARAQGVEWLVGSSTFQDAVAVASANMTMEIYNEIRGKVLHHRPDFPIRELVFFDEEELDEQGRACLATVRAGGRRESNRTALIRCMGRGAPIAEQEPSSTPSNSQPAVVSASSPVSAPASEPAARSPPARSPATAANASMPVDLTDD